MCGKCMSQLKTEAIIYVCVNYQLDCFKFVLKVLFEFIKKAGDVMQEISPVLCKTKVSISPL